MNRTRMPGNTLPRTARDTRGAGELDFDADTVSAAETFPPRRVRQAGLTGGETPDGEPTADDMTPETLIAPDDSRVPRGARGPDASDRSLRTVADSAIGAGGGLDEAELADVAPVGRREAARLKEEAERHARDPNAVEPHGAAEAASRAQGNSRSGNPHR